MDLWSLGLPTPVALALLAALGYFIGRRQARAAAEPSNTRRELRRAKSVIREMETISQDVRRSLATHHASISEFKERIAGLNRRQDQIGWRELCEEAERMLKPTLELSTRIANAYDQIRQQSNLLMTFTEVRTDPLTGLSNRRALDETLENMFKLMGRYGNVFSIAIFDIDHFKRLNDDEGHLRGDEILQQVARLFDHCVRETDLVARFGGEEFVVIMPETDLEGACVFARRMRLLVEEKSAVTISGGVAMALDGDTPRSLLARADSALYSAKSGGRNRVFQHTGHFIEPLPPGLIDRADDPLLENEPPAENESEAEGGAETDARQDHQEPQPEHAGAS